MHIMEGFLPPIHAAAWGLASLPFLVMGARSVARVTREHPRTKLLLASAGAFAFVLSALKIPSVTGSCSHPTGTGLGAILFGPSVMAVLAAITAANPDYQPWFSPLWEPPSGEIESLLFALQAALGAGLLGYYLGLRRGESQRGKPDSDRARLDAQAVDARD